MKRNILLLVVAIFVAMSVSGCGYNTLQKKEETIKESWSKLMTAYLKRSELVPNLVTVVEMYAKHEKDTFTAVNEVRASAGKTIIPADASPEQLKSFIAQQDKLSGALSRMLVTVENNPQLKANTNFLALQKDLKDIDNQISARRDIHARNIKDYNVVVKSFPTNLTASIFGHSAKPQLDVENEKEVQKAPKIKPSGEK